jgi:hypothetical protein
MDGQRARTFVVRCPRASVAMTSRVQIKDAVIFVIAVRRLTAETVELATCRYAHMLFPSEGDVKLLGNRLNMRKRHCKGLAFVTAYFF